MSESRYADRFQTDTYIDDVCVRVYCVQQGLPDEWISERLWHRLVALGSGYQLHLLPLLGSSTEAVQINPQQVVSLIEEIELIAGVVAGDEALRGAIDAALRVCLAATRKGSDLRVEGP